MNSLDKNKLHGKKYTTNDVIYYFRFTLFFYYFQLPNHLNKFNEKKSCLLSLFSLTLCNVVLFHKTDYSVIFQFIKCLENNVNWKITLTVKQAVVWERVFCLINGKFH